MSGAYSESQAINMEKRSDSFSYKVSVPETYLQTSMLLLHLRICGYLHCGARAIVQ